MRKILRVLLLPAILLLLLTSCNTETTHFNYTFKGEGTPGRASISRRPARS